MHKTHTCRKMWKNKDKKKLHLQYHLPNDALSLKGIQVLSMLVETGFQENSPKLVNDEIYVDKC